MDAVDFDHARFTELHSEIVVLCRALAITPHAVVPVSAATGDNLMQAGATMPWWRGNSLSELISTLPLATTPTDQPLRMPIQDIYRMDERRVYVGRIESGRLRVGDEIILSPANKAARIASIEIWPDTTDMASTGQSIGVTLDRPIFVERGDVLSHRNDPPLLAAKFHANLLWLGLQPAAPGVYYRLRMGTAEMPVLVEPVASEDASRSGSAISRAVLRSPRLMVLDDASRLPRTGRFALYHDEAVAAVGFADLSGVADKRQRGAALVPSEHRVAAGDRVRRFGHQGGVLWLTGLSGAGKSTLAMAVEEVLFRKGYAVYVLDGDNLRAGLNADLGFVTGDRVENMRRTGEVAALFADAGFICIAALISPYAEDRARARAAARGGFHEVYLSADLKTCEARDPKGLYRRARAGEIAEFTGVSAPYEAPAAPELVVDTGSEPVAASIARIVAYVERHFAQHGLETPPAAEPPGVLVEFPANLRIAG
jgi:bifunctional enzyme CysN/CysC